MKPSVGLVLIALVTILSGCASSAKKPAGDVETAAGDQYEKGLVALNYGLADEAIRYANAALALDPGHFDSLNLLGMALYSKGDFADAAAAYERAVELRPDDAETHKNLGLAYGETGEEEKAEAAFRTSFSLDGNAAAAQYLARILYNTKQFEEALEYVEKALDKDRRSTSAYNLKGVILNQLGRYEESAGSFQAALVLTPDDVHIQVNLGIAYTNNREFDKARAVFEKALPQITSEVLRTQVKNYLDKIKDRDSYLFPAS